jgi:hypothetical protein
LEEAAIRANQPNSFVFEHHDIKHLKLNAGELPYKDRRLLFPNPEREIQANPALRNQQNDGCKAIINYKTKKPAPKTGFSVFIV